MSPLQHGQSSLPDFDRALPTHVVAFAASAGGLTALSLVLAELPADLAAPVLVVQHLDPKHRSWMAEILQRRVQLAVHQAKGGERATAGMVFIAPPDRHRLIDAQGVLSLSDAAQERFVRPSANLLFRSLAASFGPGAVAVVLSGSGEDGAEGVREVKRCGGIVIVQEEASSQFSGMPGAAIRTGVADRVLPLGEIAGAIVATVGQAGPPRTESAP